MYKHSNPRRLASGTWRRTLLLLTSAALLESCIDKSVPTMTTTARPLRLQLLASFTRVAGTNTAPPTIVLTASYLRSNAERVVLAQETIEAKAGNQQVRLSVDLKQCLDDPAITASGGCPLHVVVIMRDSTTQPKDSTEFGPLDATPGATLTLVAPAIEMTSGASPLAGVPTGLRVAGVPANSEVIWDFGDGTTSTGQSVTHVYANAGSYRPSARVNGIGVSGATSATITVVNLNGYWVNGDPPGPSGVTHRLFIQQNGLQLTGTWFVQIARSSQYWNGANDLGQSALSGSLGDRTVTITQSEECRRTITAAVIDNGATSFTGPWINGVSTCLADGVPLRYVRDVSNDFRRVTQTRVTDPLTVGSTLTLVTSIDVGNERTDRSVIWQTSDPAVATVSPTGVVAAVAAGQVYIKVSSRVSPRVFSEQLLTVIAGTSTPQVRSVTISPALLLLARGAAQQLAPMIVADSAANRDGIATVRLRITAGATTTTAASQSWTLGNAGSAQLSFDSATLPNGSITMIVEALGASGQVLAATSAVSGTVANP